MKLQHPREWFERSAEIEGDAEVGAGCAPATGSVPIVLCGHCRGTGKIELPKCLLRTLRRIRKAGKPVTTKDLLERGVGSTAINNRLTALHEFGLIQRAGKDGKLILWIPQNGAAVHPATPERS